MDGGLEWHQINEGLDSLEVEQLAVDASADALYAATSGKSVFRLLPDPDPQPLITLDQGSLQFGTVPIGFTGELTFTISNHGEAALTVEDVVSDHSEFAVLESFPRVIGPWESLIVIVQFSPSQEQSAVATISISSDDPGRPTLDLPVTGEGVTAIEPAPDVKVNGQDGPLTLNYGTPATAVLGLTAGDYLGMPCELWIRMRTPSSQYWCVDGAGWVASDAPLLFAADSMLMDFVLPIDLGSELRLGNYEFQFIVDNNSDGALDPVWQDTLSMSIVPVVDPVPDVKVNGQDGPVSLDYGTAVTATIALTAGDYPGELAEFWISIQTSSSLYWYVDGSGWVASAAPVPFTTSVIADFEFPIAFGTALPRGDYGLQFSVDNDVDGELDAVWQDTLDLSIDPAVEPTVDLKVNAQDGPLSLAGPTPVTVMLHLLAGDYRGEPAEFWINVQTPIGQYWFVAGAGWVASDLPIVCATLGLVDIHYPLNLGSKLPKGNYEFRFTVDNDVNGQFDPIWQDVLILSIE